MKYTEDIDGTIKDDDGKILMFGIERFKSDIVMGECCFICGAKPSDKEFNAEHILPNWLLGKFSLHSRKITLPNLEKQKYGGYTLPCCKDCNTRMGKYFETPISAAIAIGSDSFLEFVAKKESQYLFNWLALIFIKSHLKDAKLRAELDDSKKDERSIGERFYNYEHLHHIHCLARSFYTNAKWGPDVLGSVFIGSAKVMNGIESFDFIDSYEAHSLLLRIDDFFVCAVFDDSFRVIDNHVGEKFLSKVAMVKEGLTLLQMRELFARINHCALSIEGWPTYHSGFNLQGEYQITAKRPQEWHFAQCNWDSLGKMIWNWCGPTLEKLGISDLEKEQVLSGKNTYLLDENGSFKTDSIVSK
ncbi:MAG TPA: hypothetical protein VNJ08_03835 [Bacteriovoracaceae bacterium]|nr:hypothetical protein [Bacteriovoracaceae bacterium]